MRANQKLNLGSEFPTLLERARLMLQTLPDIVWSIGVPSREVLYVSSAVERIFGRAPEEFYANPVLWGDCLHPDDRAGLLERWSEAAEGQPWSEEYRIVKPDGEVRWLESRGRAAHDDTGKVVRIYGISRDITARREQERGIGQLSRIKLSTGRCLVRGNVWTTTRETTLPNFIVFSWLVRERTSPIHRSLL
jgi:PAS domain S-box-containing protein